VVVKPDLFNLLRTVQQFVQMGYGIDPIPHFQKDFPCRFVGRPFSFQFNQCEDDGQTVFHPMPKFAQQRVLFFRQSEVGFLRNPSFADAAHVALNHPILVHPIGVADEFNVQLSAVSGSVWLVRKTIGISQSFGKRSAVWVPSNPLPRSISIKMRSTFLPPYPLYPNNRFRTGKNRYPLLPVPVPDQRLPRRD
jgi:hypothetical protein